MAGRAKATNRALSSGQKNGIFRIGVASALLDEALLPLRGDLTGRRLGLLVYLHGSDIREKYSGVRHSDERHCPVGERSVAPRAIKTNQSTTLFVLHDFLKEIGFVDWARAQGQAFLFPELTRLVDPSKSGSSYMQRLFRKAGVSGNGRGVFHSLRGGHLDFMRNAKVDLATGGFKGATRSTTNTTSMASRRSRKVWAMDFVHDQLATGKKIRVLTVVDTFTRYVPVLDPRFSYRAEDVVRTLERVCPQIGYPKKIRVDQGSEFISRDLDLWAYAKGVTLDFSRPGKPTDNAYIEAFNGRFRAECLNAHWFLTLADAAEKMEDWRRYYNEVRPHGAIGHKVPISLLNRDGATSPPS